jgi:hypothetical protein
MSIDNTTNNFEELTFSSLLNKYDKILIPMIQRDYAQGRTDKKAQEVRMNILNDIFEKESVHFDLIFGSCEKRNENDGEKQCFIPVDGQQRLTTLFLLNLYAQKTGLNNEELNLSKFSYDTRRTAADFCKKVVIEEWNVSNGNVSDAIKDSVWFMNYWENDPTVAGMLNMLDAIHEKANAKGIVFPNLNKVKFYFFDLESNGLNENLYLKMNSRGKPLTAFENLKASIEKELPQGEFAKKWKYNMDRDWTNAFWNKEKLEETDKNTAAFIVRFLSGYYNAFCKSNEGNKVAENLKDINNKESYSDFISFEPIRESLKLPQAFQKLALAFTVIANNEIKPNWNETIKTTGFHEYKIVAVVFAYVLFDGNPQAMRVAWNLAENTVLGYDNFIAYCKRIGEILSYHEENKYDIYQILASKEFINPSAQLTEEIDKAKQILNGEPRSDGKSWEEIIIKAESYPENNPFFKGAIRFLYTDEKGNVTEDSWQQFDTKFENAKHRFDKASSTIELVNYCNDDQIKDVWTCHSFNTKNWKSILLRNSLNKPIHNFLLKEKETNESTLASDLKRMLEANFCVDIWLLLNWQECKVVLTNYSTRRSEPYKGWVFEVGNAVRNRWNTITKNMQEISIIPPTDFEPKSYEFGNQLYHIGLWTDFKYNQYYFRYYGNNTICLMNNNWNGKRLRSQQNTDVPENSFYFCVDSEENKGTFLQKLNCIIAQAESNDSEKMICKNCQEKICEQTE